MKEYLGLSWQRILAYRAKTHVDTFKYYLKYQLPYSKAINRTRALKGTQRGNSAFVFGNGPSMQKIDPRKIKGYQDQGYQIIAVNNFLYSEISNLIKPDYIVFSDPLDFVDVSDDHPRAERARIGKLQKEKVVASNIPLFIPLTYFRLHQTAPTYYFCDAENIFSKNVADITKPRGYMSWTGMKALAIACYLGFSEIYICGMDYDMFRNLKVNENCEPYWLVEHFYDDDELKGYKIDKSSNTTGEILYFAHLNFTVHEKFKEFPIFNLDPESLVDTFSKNHKLDVSK